MEIQIQTAETGRQLWELSGPGGRLSSASCVAQRPVAQGASRTWEVPFAALTVAFQELPLGSLPLGLKGPSQQSTPASVRRDASHQQRSPRDGVETGCAGL